MGLLPLRRLCEECVHGRRQPSNRGIRDSVTPNLHESHRTTRVVQLHRDGSAGFDAGAGQIRGDIN